ncbi:hypothetical protein APSETT444_003967 [Aspergillus pseudonomiae]
MRRINVRQLDRPWDGRDSRPNGQVGNDQHGQDHEARDTQRPAESDAWQQSRQHRGEHDPAEGGAAGHNAKGQGAPLIEPGRGAGERRVEDEAGAQRAADALGENELVILVRDGGHHETEDVQKRPNEKEPFGAVIIENLKNR